MKLVEEWVVLSKLEKALDQEMEVATYDKQTGEWTGWTTPGYRQRRGRQLDSFPTLESALGLVRQVREKYPHATAVPLFRVVRVKARLRGAGKVCPHE